MRKALEKPRVDRRQLQQIIAGLSEGIILVDPDGSIEWANETALSVHGVDKPAGLGKSAQDYIAAFTLKYRNNHVLTPEQYPVMRVLAGERLHNVIVELAKTDDPAFRRVQRIRSLVLTDEEDEPESLVLVIQDETERFNAEDRFERTFNTNPAPALICRLSDLRYVKVNPGFLQMTGFARDEVLGCSVVEIDVLNEATRREEGLRCLQEGRTISQMEATLQLPDGQAKLVVVAGQPIEVGEEACMLFTFMDLEPRKVAEDALRQSEERFSKAFRLAPVPMAVSSLEGLLLMDVNEAFVETTGYAAEEAVARDPSELQLWADDRMRRKLRETLEAGGSVRNEEVRLRTRNGDILDCLLSAEAVTIHGQRCVLTAIQDITDRKRGEEELVAAIDTVMRDASWFSRSVIEKLAQLRRPEDTQAPAAQLADLTPREREVLGLMCEGTDNAGIARALKLSQNTIRNHIATLYSKIGVHRRSDAIVWARRRGITSYEKAATRHRRLPRT
ncbi:MAG: PAS domain S-box protein [Pigmentiphaga sp.]|uniref:helix-turn-helix transcriptional regulator n=1 Tax=Pigmentiphaga sp. TaxID=1977564 RepID=UPI0029BE1C1E|nr:PAS domain S-box protein [Pigmentiphaga sp.]MDX3906202.1 PAS domain S-box protein [Pigmentiphaga sp.]